MSRHYRDEGTQKDASASGRKSNTDRFLGKPVSTLLSLQTDLADYFFAAGGWSVSAITLRSPIAHTTH